MQLLKQSLVADLQLLQYPIYNNFKMFKIIKYIEKKFTVSKNGTEKSMLSTRDVVILTDVIAKSALFSIKSLIIPFHSPFFKKNKS